MIKRQRVQVPNVTPMRRKTTDKKEGGKFFRDRKPSGNALRWRKGKDLSGGSRSQWKCKEGRAQEKISRRRTKMGGEACATRLCK